MKKKKSKHDYDSPWKQLIENLLESFMKFFFPRAFKEIDFSRGYEFKNKELYKLLKDQEIGKRYTDELIKVYLKDGTEQWLLIHIEVQGYKEKDFAERLMIYNYRLFDKYRHDVITMAVLTDPDETYKPNTYLLKRMGFKHEMVFPLFKVTDYKKRVKELEKSKNPMAIVVLAQLKNLEIKNKPESERFDIKITLIRMLYEKGFSKKQINELFRFIDWMINLSPVMESKIIEEIQTLEEVRKMTYVTFMERAAKKEGKKEGKMEDAEKMLKKEFSIEDIKDITGLTKREILRIQKKLEND